MPLPTGWAPPSKPSSLGTAACRSLSAKQCSTFTAITHGGLVFALGDIAFAAASNSHGRTSLALNVAISFLRPANIGDQLVAEAKEVQPGKTTALYDIVVTDRNSQKLIAKSQATVYRTRESFV
ncbi:MAG: hotdog fold thioesterase [Desulfobulbus oligotrophicus]|jgi:acyl-CoA thioesterase|nr:hotdog fold thioesterase [Desulfobulbus oligotrophicus]